MRATLTAEVPVLTRPANSRISLGGVPWASITVGPGMSRGMGALLPPRVESDGMRKEASRTFRSRRVVFALSAALVGSISPLSRASVPAAEARRELDAMGRAASELRDYTMTLVSQEWDGHRLGVPQTLLAKFARPFSVYYKRLCEPHKGR